ncbi:DUF1661 domain-containing protein [Porphyromonas gingivalis]|uniref:DUF1661 domain-containing protein n=1 Tax=Porphyromonas gingivalis TaxID=837 RepID=UPI001F165A2D|nr:DUF1661 domain-containing protein [Porphyromonas gingivalis]
MFFLKRRARIFPFWRDIFFALAWELFISRAKTKKFTRHVFRGDKPEILGA